MKDYDEIIRKSKRMIIFIAVALLIEFCNFIYQLKYAGRATSFTYFTLGFTLAILIEELSIKELLKKFREIKLLYDGIIIQVQEILKETEEKKK